MIRVLLAIAGACMALSIAVAATPPPPPVEAFFADPEFRIPKLSPSGRHMALIGKMDFGDHLIIFDADSLQRAPGATFTNLKVLNYWWKGDDMLMFLLEDFQGFAFFRSFDRKTMKFGALHAFNRRAAWIVNPLVGDPDHMIVSAFGSLGVDLRRLNVRTGKSEVIQRNPGFVERWLTDRDGNPVAAVEKEDEKWFMLFRADDGKDWNRIPLGTKNLPSFLPIAVYSDQRRIIGWDYVSADTARVVVRDPKTGADELLAHSAALDPEYNAVWGDDETRIRAIVYEADPPHFHYLNPADAAVARSIDQALPETTNSIVSTSADESRLIILSQSDTVPERYSLLDRAKSRLSPLGGARSGLDPATLSPAKRFTFRSRDGLIITAKLITPRDTAKPPLIVSAGSNLTARSNHLFQPAMQLLASRGYAVLQVDHRGVEGYGRKFAAAGDSQVDAAMTDDIADAVAHVTAQGWIDADRVALLGMNEGGVLALHTLARHGALFGALINLNTPLDREPFPTDTVTFGVHERRGRDLPFAEQQRLRNYVRELDPAAKLPAIKVPSFHYYTREVRDASGHRAKRFLEKAKLPHVFLVTPVFDREAITIESRARVSLRETTRVYTEMLKFLGDHFSTPGNADTPQRSPR